MRFKLSVGAVMVALNGRLLEGSVHPLDLTIGPRMIGLGQPVLNAVGGTKHVEHMETPPRRLQHYQIAQRARQSATSRLCKNQRSRNATERGAALRRELRAPTMREFFNHWDRCIKNNERFFRCTSALG